MSVVTLKRTFLAFVLAATAIGFAGCRVSGGIDAHTPMHESR